MPTFFISGHVDLTANEFRDHYARRIAAVLANDIDTAFVVGDADGCDLMTQIYLQRARALRVQVFHLFDSPRNNVGGFPTVGGFLTDNARDAAMTDVSDADIAWTRPGHANSETAANLARRYFKKKGRCA